MKKLPPCVWIVLALLLPVCGVAASVIWAPQISVGTDQMLDTLLPWSSLVSQRGWVILGVSGFIGASAGLLAAYGSGARQVLPLRLLLPLATGLISVVLTWCVMNRGTDASQSTPRVVGGKQDLRILSFNSYKSHGKAAQISALAARLDADIISMPETNLDLSRKVAALTAAKTGKRFEVWSDDRGAEPTSRKPGPTSLIVNRALRPKLLGYGTEQGFRLGHVQVQIRNPAGGEPLKFAAVHVSPPGILKSRPGWRRELTMLQRFCREGWILAGDFNAVPEHSPMRNLRKAGCEIPSQDLRRPGGSWPSTLPQVFGINIDHILFPKGFSSRSRDGKSTFGRAKLAGSDHRAVWATLRATGN